MINNLATYSEFQNLIIGFREDLENYLKKTNDPRIKGESPWDNYNLDGPPGEVVKDE